MLNALENRLIDLLADLLARETQVQLVSRPRADLAIAAVDPDRVAVVVQVLSVSTDSRLGDDARDRSGQKGGYQLQTVLRLNGQMAIDLIINPAAGANLESHRQTLLHVLDRLLAALHTASFRNGRSFQSNLDLGFDLEGFRLARAGAPENAPAGFSTVRAIYDFSGRFWPLEPLLAGEVISQLPLRLAILPVRIPELPVAQAGGPDLAIPLHLDLRVLNGAPVLVLARLRGASPPGKLAGSAANAPAGWTGFTPDSAGIATLIYQPPTTLAQSARVTVSTALGGTSQPPVTLAEFDIEVRS